MKFKSGKLFFTVALLLLIRAAAYPQKEFFRSQQVFTGSQMANFYSSITIEGDWLLFSANDYHLYAYNKKSHLLQWSYNANYKSSIPVFVLDSIVYAGIYTNDKEQAVQLELVNGKFARSLPFGPLATKPFVKNNILYGTAIYNYGCMIAYDLERDTVTWSRFIAHGFSNRPYYQANRIMVSAEANNWVTMGYDGLLDTTCADKPDFFVEGIPCVKKFMALSHDGREIKGKLAKDIFGEDVIESPDVITTNNLTVILSGDKLSILSGKLKKKWQVAITSLSGDLVDNGQSKLIKAGNESAWLLYGDHLLQYNYKTNSLARIINLAYWQPQQVLLDEENIWLVSLKDGLLYGLSL